MKARLIDEFGTKKELIVTCLEPARSEGDLIFVLGDWDELKSTFGWGYYSRPIAIKLVNGHQFYIRINENVVPMFVGQDDHSGSSEFMQPSVVARTIDNFEVFKMLKNNE